MDCWELFARSGDGELLLASLCRTDTGLLRGQGRVEARWLRPRRGATVLLETVLPRGTAPAAPGGLRLGDSQLQWEGSRGRLDLRGAELQATLQLRATAPALPAQERGPRPGDWRVGLPAPRLEVTGWIAATPHRRPFRGVGFLARRTGRRPPLPAGRGELVAIATGEQVFVGVDATGSSARTWAIVGGVPLPPLEAALRPLPRGGLEVDFRPQADLVARLAPRPPRHQEGLLGHLTALERLLLRPLLGRPVLRVAGARARIALAGRAAVAPGALAWRGAPGAILAPPTRRRR